MSSISETTTPEGLHRITLDTTLEDIEDMALQLTPALGKFVNDKSTEQVIAALAFWFGSYLAAAQAVVDFGNPPENTPPHLAKVFYDKFRREGLN